MYNGKKNESLNVLQKRKYCEKVAKNLHRVEGKSLPLPQLLQNFTVTKSIYKFVNEKILIAICRKNHGVGSSLIQDTPCTIHLPRLNCLKSFDVIAPQIALLQDVLAAKMVWNAHLPVVIVKALHVQMEVQWMWQKKILMKLMIKIEAFLNPKTENQELGCMGINIWFWVLTLTPN